MRENRTYGSEGGAAETNRPSLPLSCYRRSAAEKRNIKTNASGCGAHAGRAA